MEFINNLIGSYINNVNNTIKNDLDKIFSDKSTLTEYLSGENETLNQSINRKIMDELLINLKVINENLEIEIHSNIKGAYVYDTLIDSQGNAHNLSCLFKHKDSVIGYLEPKYIINFNSFLFSKYNNNYVRYFYEQISNRVFSYIIEYYDKMNINEKIPTEKYDEILDDIKIYCRRKGITHYEININDMVEYEGEPKISDEEATKIYKLEGTKENIIIKLKLF